MADTPQSHSISRGVEIHASPATVYRLLTESALFARWAGEGSEISAEAGSPMIVRFPNGDTAEGEVMQSERDELVVFTWGYPIESKGVPVGSTRVEITLDAQDDGTELELKHSGFANAEIANAHVGGWRHMLSKLSTSACEEQVGEGLDERIDAYFAAWNEDDPAKRPALLADSVTEDFVYRDKHGMTTSRIEYLEYVNTTRAHMPNSHVVRMGPVSLSEGLVLVRWSVTSEGKPLASGTNVCYLSGRGLLREVRAFWED